VKKPTGPKLSPEEIAKLLAMGAKASDRTVIPGEDERALAILKNALYAAWIRPTNDQKGRRPAQIELRVDRFGVVTGRRLLQSSGSPAMDASVERAAAAVRQVLKLPAGFTDRFPAVIIEFELE
jgi:TonB family protein